MRGAHVLYAEIYVDCDIRAAKYDLVSDEKPTYRGSFMPRYNRQFELSIADVDLIEEALRARGRELSRMRLALSEENPAHLESIRVIEQDQRENEDLLGRLHDQKIFYRPQKAVYVSG